MRGNRNSNKVPLNRASQQITQTSYREHWRDYEKKTNPELSTSEKDWLKPILTLPRTKSILEVGAGTGRTSDYLEKQGFMVQRSDGTKEFVDLMNEKELHFPAIEFDLLSDRLPKAKYDLVIANAVLLHFNRKDLIKAVDNIGKALHPEGLLYFTLKQGSGEKIALDNNLKRFFKFWSVKELEDFFASLN